ncbi:unnamed protein product [Microthlaspi erraticum]|uniref:Uncharacterized protein n=1 Tax=Microthlaspi erraticum TaxID=1685480 RepID=A0A6D2JW44_9BRAS|nr:unnamed protein product [Microthlaspi erraticum]
MTHVIPIPLNAHPMSRLPPSMWCDRPIGYNSSYPLRCWWLVLHPDSSKSISSPLSISMSPFDWFGQFLSLMRSWVSLPDRIRSSWSLSTIYLLHSSWCRCPIGLGLLRLHSNTSIPNIYASCSRCGIDLGRPSHLSICSSDLHSASTKLLRMVSYVVQTLLFLIWRTLIFRRPVDSSHVRTMIVPPGQSCCIFTSARSFLILS